MSWSCLTFAVLRQTASGYNPTGPRRLLFCASRSRPNPFLSCRIIKEAFYLARTGRPGPVLVDVPKDIQQQLAVPDWSTPMAISGYMSRLPQPPQERELKRVIEALHGVRACPQLSCAAVVSSGRGSYCLAPVGMCSTQSTVLHASQPMSL